LNRCLRERAAHLVEVLPSILFCKEKYVMTAFLN